MSEAALLFADADGRKYILRHNCRTRDYGDKLLHYVTVSRYSANGDSERICTKAIIATSTLLACLSKGHNIYEEHVSDVLLSEVFRYCISRLEMGNFENEELMLRNEQQDQMNWSREKECEFLLRDGTDLSCKKHAGKIGEERTTRAVCKSCDFPEIFYRCIHMVNIRTFPAFGDETILERVAEFDCDKQKEIINCLKAECRVPWEVRSSKLNEITSGSQLVGKDGKQFTVYAQTINQVNYATDGGTVNANDTSLIIAQNLNQLTNVFHGEVQKTKLNNEQIILAQEIKVLLETIIEQKEVNKQNNDLLSLCLRRIQNFVSTIEVGTKLYSYGQKLMEYINNLLNT